MRWGQIQTEAAPKRKALYDGEEIVRALFLNSNKIDMVPAIG